MNSYKEAKIAIDSGELVVFPTETVYGLATDALNPDAVDNVYDCKERSYDKPISLAVPNIDEAKNYVDINKRERSFMKKFLPGPATVLLPKNNLVPDILTSGRQKVGVRVPDNQVAIELLEEVNPITATSANISGTGSVLNLDNLSDEVKNEAEVLLDDGILNGGVGSTVVDLRENKIYRDGAIHESVNKWISNN